MESSIVQSFDDFPFIGLARKIVDFIGVDKLSDFFNNSEVGSFLGGTITYFLLAMLAIMSVTLLVKIILEVI